MSLGLALNNALSGLKVNQQSLSVLSHNIANVNTVGYSRQVLQQSAVTIDGLGGGVRIDDIVRKIDKYLQRSTQTQGTVYNDAATIDAFYQRIQNVLGQPGASNSIDTSLTRFFNNIQGLAQTPETTSLKSNAIAGAEQFAKQLSDLAGGIENLRLEADSQISDAVQEINGVLRRIQTINAAINQSFALGQSTADLLDARDLAVSTLSDFVSITVSYSDSGAATVVGGGGVMLVEEGVLHQLSYAKASSVSTFTSESTLAPLRLLTLNSDGREVGTPVDFLTAGSSADVTSRLVGGKLEALHQLRDVKLPETLEQLDMLASRLRDEVNAIHNDGSGFPPATSLTGDRLLRPGSSFTWQGYVRIAALNSDGSAVTSYYTDEEYTGVRPLLLNLGGLDSGEGQGKPTVQTIIDEINNHFGSPANKAKLGNLNNIQLVSDTTRLPSGATSLFDFDLDLDNISSSTASVFVTDITVLDDTATNITSITQGAPSLTIQGSGSYTTVSGSADVTITLTSVPDLAVGDTINLAAPSGAVNGIPAASLTGYFTVTAVNGTQVTFTAAAAATATGSVNDPSNVTVYPPYHTIASGIKERTRDDGIMQVDFTASPGSAYYDVTLDVTVVDEDGTVSTAPITYRVSNNQQDLLSKRYNTTAVGGAGTMVTPTSARDTLRAILVDADGVELPKTPTGKYLDAAGYLKIVGSEYEQPISVAIDEMDSRQLGRPDDLVPEAGTGWGFSHYFGLNNFFASNDPIITGDTLKNSALNLHVEDRLMNNANLISTGSLVRQNASQATQFRDVFTYVRYSGDDSIVQRMSQLNAQSIAFDAAGGLPDAQLTLGSYTAQIMGSISQKSAEASANATNAKTLYDTFKAKSDSISNVNLDEELANTVVFQNAYSATARVLTTVNKMYDDLLASF